MDYITGHTHTKRPKWQVVIPVTDNKLYIDIAMKWHPELE